MLKSLALQVVRDGEGARKQVEITVTGARSARSARKIALSIANSPLVKTAIAGEDANWGRIVMAVGKAGEPADRDTLSIRFGATQVATGGLAVEGYDEAPVAAHLAHGRSLADAVPVAQRYVAGAIASAPGLGRGHGPMDHFWQVRRDLP